MTWLFLFLKVVLVFLAVIAIIIFWLYVVNRRKGYMPDIDDVIAKKVEGNTWQEQGKWYWRNLDGDRCGPYLDYASAARNQISYLMQQLGYLQLNKALKDAAKKRDA